MIRLLLILLFPISVFADCSAISNPNPQDLPTGLDYFYTLEADANFTNRDSTEYVGNFVNSTGTTFDTFRTNFEDETGNLVNFITKAKAYFNASFGINFTGASTVSDGGDWDLVDFDDLDADNSIDNVIPLEYGQKILFSGGETVRTAGWNVYQAFVRIQAKTDGALVVSGDWVDEKLVKLGLTPGSSQIPVLQGTIIDYGVFRVVCDDGVTTSEFDIFYRSKEPIFPDYIVDTVNALYPGTYNTLNRRLVDYDLSLDAGTTWPGRARGRSETLDLGGGTERALTKVLMKIYTP